MPLPKRRAYDPVAAGCLCAQCPLRGKPVVPPKGPPDADFMIVGETPGYHEEQKGEPFIGASGVELDSIFHELGKRGWNVSRKRTWLTNVIMCRPETPDVGGTKRYDFPTYLAWIRKQNADLRKTAIEQAKANGWKKGDPPPQWVPISSPIDCCAPRLWAEIGHFEAVARARGELHGIAIVPVGNHAAEAVVGRAGIMKIRGSPFLIDLNDPRAHLHREPWEGNE
jgi:uracil-DNA glycosylase